MVMEGGINRDYGGGGGEAIPVMKVMVDISSSCNDNGDGGVLVIMIK